MEPGGAGFDVEFKVPSKLMAAICPAPDGSNVRKAGEVVPITTVVEAVTTPLRSTTTTECVLPATLFGTMAVICAESTRIKGAATPSNNTCVPERTAEI